MVQISDKQLFEELNLETESLSRVSSAIRENDFLLAKSELVAYLRTRTSPIPPPLDEQQDQRGHGLTGDKDHTIEANRIVDHVFEFVGHPPQQLGRQITWNEDPVDYEQWSISLNRHFHWITLAKAYEATDDEKYAQEFASQLRSWINAMPVEIGSRFIQGGWAPEGKMSLSLDAGIRMGQTWVPAFYSFLNSPSFSVSDCIAMVKAFRDHAVYLMDPVHFRSLSNWGVMEGNGLYQIGVYFPEFKASSDWRDTAMSRLRREIDLQVYPDGAQIELTSGYHHVSLSNFVLAYRAALRNNINVPEDYLASLEQMYHYSLYVAFPNLCMPAVNDSGSHNIQRAMQDAHEFFPGRADFEWASTGRQSGRPPEAKSTAFPYAGHFVMRSGWESDNACLFFDGGPFGYGHQHEDKLNIILYAHGQTLIADPGNYQYDTSEWRKYMLSSWSHNTVIVDGQGQHQQGKPREQYIVKKPLPYTWISEPGFDYASASYNEGYGPERNRTVTHRRSILYIKPDLWIVTDILSPSDDAVHHYESAFVLATDEASAEGLVVMTSGLEGPTCAIYGQGPSGTSLRIASGERDPDFRGWMPKNGDISCCHPTPTAVYSFSGSGKVITSYVIVPIPKAGPNPIASLNFAPTSPSDVCAIGGVIQRTDGRQIYFVQREPGEHRVYLLNGETNAEAGAMIVNSSGCIEAMHLPAGAAVRGDGQPLTTGNFVY